MADDVIQQLIAISIDEHCGTKCLVITYCGLEMYCTLGPYTSTSRAFKRIYPLIKMDALTRAEKDIRHAVTDEDKLLATDEFKETLKNFSLRIVESYKCNICGTIRNSKASMRMHSILAHP